MNDRPVLPCPGTLRRGRTAPQAQAFHREKSRKSANAEVLLALNDLAFYRTQGRYADAEPLYLHPREGRGDPNTWTWR